MPPLDVVGGIFFLSSEEVASYDDQALHFNVEFHLLDYEMACRSPVP